MRYLVIKTLPLDTGMRRMNTYLNKVYPIGTVVKIADGKISNGYPLTRNEIKTCFKELS